MAFVKLDCGILDSTLWVEAAEVRVVFLTILAMCGPDGLCRATAPGIARRANLPLDGVRQALAALEGPDADSRTLTNQGRRIERVDGGYHVLNYLKYRALDHTAAERKRRQRARAVTAVTRDVTEGHGESRKQKQKQIQKQTTDLPADAGQPEPSNMATNWNREAVDDFRAAYSADPPKQFLAQVKAVAQKFGWSATRPALRAYMDETPEYQYLNIPKVLAVKIQQEQNGRRAPGPTRGAGNGSAIPSALAHELVSNRAEFAAEFLGWFQENGAGELMGIAFGRWRDVKGWPGDPLTNMILRAAERSQGAK